MLSVCVRRGLLLAGIWMESFFNETGRACREGANRQQRANRKGRMLIFLSVDLFSAGCFDRLLQVLDQIIRVLDAYAEPHERIAEPVPDPFLPGNGGMGHAGRVIDQGFYTAQTFGECKETGRREQLVGGFYVVVLQGETHHAAKTTHLSFCDGVSGMILKAAPVHLSHFGMISQIAGDLFAVITMPVHAYMEGLQAPQHEEAVLWTRNGP